MKHVSLILLCAFASLTSIAQTATQVDDPVLMTINGKNVTRSEFEYSFHKNGNVAGAVEKKTVQEYLPMFVDYKLKVAAAEAAQLDTLSSFKDEFLTYRDIQLTPYLVDSAFIDSIALVVYNNTAQQLGGKDLIETAHILLRVGTNDSDSAKKAAQAKADSLYNALQQGADFADLARRFSQDLGTAARGGALPLAGPGSFIKEFEEAAYALQHDGELSKPILSPFGYHIIKMIHRKPLDPFETVKPQILAMLKRQNIEETSSQHRIQQIVEASHGQLTREAVLDSVMQAHIGTNLQLRYLIQEYHDGLLLYEVSKRQVWDVAQNDNQGLENWYKAHKGNYTWNKPRFNGFVFHAKTTAQAKAVKKMLKKETKVGGDWRKALHNQFNADSTCVTVTGPYLCSEGENAFIDTYAFQSKNQAPQSPKGYSVSGVYGKVQKQPKTWLDVKAQVTADYQAQMEKDWVASLHQRFTYTINEDVLSTVKP